MDKTAKPSTSSGSSSSSSSSSSSANSKKMDEEQSKLGLKRYEPKYIVYANVRPAPKFLLFNLLYNDQISPKKQELVDAKINCKDGFIKTHRFLLLAVSEIIQKHWSYQVLEVDEDSRDLIILLPDYSVSDVALFLYILYKGNVKLTAEQSILVTDLLYNFGINIYTVLRSSNGSEPPSTIKFSYYKKRKIEFQKSVNSNTNNDSNSSTSTSETCSNSSSSAAEPKQGPSHLNLENNSSNNNPSNNDYVPNENSKEKENIIANPQQQKSTVPVTDNVEANSPNEILVCSTSNNSNSNKEKIADSSKSTKLIQNTNEERETKQNEDLRSKKRKRGDSDSESDYLKSASSSSSPSSSSSESEYGSESDESNEEVVLEDEDEDDVSFSTIRRLTRSQSRKKFKVSPVNRKRHRKSALQANSKIKKDLKFLEEKVEEQRSKSGKGSKCCCDCKKIFFNNIELTIHQNEKCRNSIANCYILRSRYCKMCMLSHTNMTESKFLNHVEQCKLKKDAKTNPCFIKLEKLSDKVIEDYCKKRKKLEIIKNVPKAKESPKRDVEERNQEPVIIDQPIQNLVINSNPNLTNDTQKQYKFKDSFPNNKSNLKKVGKSEKSTKFGQEKLISIESETNNSQDNITRKRTRRMSEPALSLSQFKEKGYRKRRKSAELPEKEKIYSTKAFIDKEEYKIVKRFVDTPIHPQSTVSLKGIVCFDNNKIIPESSKLDENLNENLNAEKSSIILNSNANNNEIAFLDNNGTIQAESSSGNKTALSSIEKDIFDNIFGEDSANSEDSTNKEKNMNLASSSTNNEAFPLITFGFDPEDCIISEKDFFKCTNCNDIFKTQRMLDFHFCEEEDN